jgi:hypothetical protein
MQVTEAEERLRSWKIAYEELVATIMKLICLANLS